MPDFTRVITLAYQRILARPADPGGLENYNQLMNGGLTEAAMRESLLRSPEYAQKNPSFAMAARMATSLSSKKKKMRTAGSRKRKTARAR